MGLFDGHFFTDIDRIVAARHFQTHQVAVAFIFMCPRDRSKLILTAENYHSSNG
jgi:hypothetical protein